MYEIDELASIVAMANAKEQQALTLDIQQNGQEELAVLWRGKLIDGRCRQLACIALGVELKVRELDSDLSREDVALIVKSLNIRRNLTQTQKVMSAIKEQEQTREANQQVADSWGIGITTLKNGKYILKYRPELVDPLFDGRSVELDDLVKGYKVTTNKVNTAARVLKRNLEYGVVGIDDSEIVQFSVDSSLKTELAKEWYYTNIQLDNVPKDAVAIKMKYVQLANMIHKLSEEEK